MSCGDVQGAGGTLGSRSRTLLRDCVYVCPVSRHSAGASYFSIVLCYIVSLGMSGRRTAEPPRRCAAGKRAAELLARAAGGGGAKSL